MKTSIKVTDHACKRMRERMGLNKKAAHRVVDIAYKNGICKEDAKGQLCKYMEARNELYAREGSKVIIYGEMVYCFVDDNDTAILITVYRIPNSLRNQANKAKVA